MKNLAVLLEYLLVVTGLSAIVPLLTSEESPLSFLLHYNSSCPFHSYIYIYICMVANFDSVFATSLEVKISVGAFTEIPRKVPAPAHVAT